VGKAPASFESDLSRLDAAILNIQRACQAALDMGRHLIYREKLGVPQSEYDVFELLHLGGWLEARLQPVMKTLVGFRHITVHDDQALQLPVTIAIITQHMGDIAFFSSVVLRKDASL
jgi:uncharacterized protein YutE (UPF0331/DUF86 family)